MAHLQILRRVQNCNTVDVVGCGDSESGVPFDG